MEKIIINLENIFDIDKLDYCLQTNHHINTYEIDTKKNSITIYMKYGFEMPNVSYDLDRYGFKIISATLQKDEFYIPFLEALIDKKAIEQEVLKENSQFNLENFYVNGLEGAICVVTKNQIIFANAVINHCTSLNYVYNFLYNGLDDIEDYYSSDNCWQIKATAFGNIVIQLCSDVSSTVWLPEELNDYQQSQLNKILGQIKQVRQKHNIPIDVEISRPNDLMQKYKNNVK